MRSAKSVNNRGREGQRAAKSSAKSSANAAPESAPQAFSATHVVPITQSHAWQKLQDDLGEQSFLVDEPDFCYLAILKSTPVGNYLYLPYGPVYKGKASFKKALASLTTLARQHHAIFIRIEPQDPDFSSYAPKNAAPSLHLSPADTWRLDLTPPAAELVSHFSQGTRTRHNNYAKKGLSVSVSHNPDDIHYLVELQSALAARKGIQAYDASYLRTELAQPFASLYLVHYQPPEEPGAAAATPVASKVIAASLFFDHAGTRYYMQSAADSEYRRLPGTVALLSRAIFDAKEQGIKTFDFWGIAPDGAPASHPWAGFTEFKKSFGGYPVHYAGTYDLVESPAKYRLYQLTRKINRLFRRLH